MSNASYKLIEKSLRSGDTLLLLSDGLPEQMNSSEEMFDYSRVKEQFKANIKCTPETIITKLVEATDSWMEGRIQDDDISFVVVRIK